MDFWMLWLETLTLSSSAFSCASPYTCHQGPRGTSSAGRALVHPGATGGAAVVAVGTVVAHRPPHRSVRAELLHTAPTKGVDVKPLRRMRVKYFARGQVFADHTAEP